MRKLTHAQASLDSLKYETRFHLALDHYQAKEYFKAKDLLEDYLSGLDAAAERNSTALDLSTDLNARLDEYRLYIDLCGGLQHIENGDNLFQRAKDGSDGDLDDFTYAVLLAQDEYK